jgi:hypothetical protein
MRCATTVCIQCCVDRSQSLRKVSFEPVKRKPGADDVDVEGPADNSMEMNFMAVI